MILVKRKAHLQDSQCDTEHHRRRERKFNESGSCSLRILASRAMHHPNFRVREGWLEDVRKLFIGLLHSRFHSTPQAFLDCLHG